MVKYKFGWHSGKLTVKDIEILDTLDVKGSLTFGDAAADTLTVTGTSTFNAGVTINAGLVIKHVSKDNDYTASTDDVIIGVDTSGGAVTITLPSAGAVAGKVYVIHDEGGDAGTNAITIATEGSETIDGNSSATINSNYGTLRIYSDGTNFFTF